jgi:hypothetical protein
MQRHKTNRQAREHYIRILTVLWWGGLPEEIVSASKIVRGSDPFKNTRTREEVNMQWVRSSVSAGLPMRFFDNKEVRKTDLFTSDSPECGNNYIGQVTVTVCGVVS